MLPLLQVMSLTINVYHPQMLPSAKFGKNNLLFLINEKLKTKNCSHVIQFNHKCGTLHCLASISFLISAADLPLI